MKQLLKSILPAKLSKYLGQKRANLLRRQRPKYDRPRAHSKQVLSAVIAYSDHGGYAVPTASAHRPAAQLTLAGAAYEAKTQDFLRANYEEGSIIHAGAYFGDMLPSLAKIVGNRGLIWSFEPNGESYRCAKITTIINNLNNVKLYNYALGEAASSKTLVTHDKTGRALGGSSYLSEAKAGEAVKVVSLDEMVNHEEKVAVIHLDLEGYEENALVGARRIIKQWKPILILETLPSDDWINDNLAPLGYQVSHQVDKNTVLSAA